MSSQLTVRLAMGGPPKALEIGLSDDSGPSVRLALSGVHSKDKKMAMEDQATRPALLVSYVYLKQFLANRHKYSYRDWVMDSGAFSAHASGATINLQDYIDCCKALMASDQTLTEIFSLDVIGDWNASRKNCEEMWKQGVPAIPCYHVGEPVEVLKKLAADYPKIALGGCVGFKGKDKFAEQCFARVWPKAIHGFGFGGEKSIMSLPWHSVDATNWEIGPCKFGRWNSFGAMSIRGGSQDLRSEVQWYLDLERRARMKWSGAMKQLTAQQPNSPQLDLPVTQEPHQVNELTLRLAVVSTGREVNNL